MDYQNLVQLLNKYLPQILPHVTSDKRIVIFIFSNNKTVCRSIRFFLYENDDFFKFAAISSNNTHASNIRTRGYYETQDKKRL